MHRLCDIPMTSAQRWTWGLLAVLVTLSIVFLLMLEADATGYNCQGRTRCGTTTTTEQEESSTTTTAEATTTTQENSTTTTPPSTTTLQPSTTSTFPAGSTTAPTDNTTTSSSLPDLLAAAWDAYATCDTLTVLFDEGIVQVDVYLRDPLFGDFGPADGVGPFTESGTLETGIVAEWILIPVTLTGYTAVPPENILFTSHCTPGPSTTIDPPTSTSSVPELPRTGVATRNLIAIALVVSTLGFMLVKEAGRE